MIYKKLLVIFYDVQTPEKDDENKNLENSLENQNNNNNNNSSTKPILLWQHYFTVPFVEGISSPSSSSACPSGIFVCSDGSSGLGHAVDLQQAKNIFNNICPGESFLPYEQTENELDEDVRRVLQQNSSNNSTDNE